MKKLIILSGVSGAGKTTASNFFEDKGYKCIDQYPVELLENLIDLIQKDDSIKYQKVVLTIPISDLEKYESLLNNTELKPTLILMDADRDEIINRYKFTRRIHPLLSNNIASTLKEAVDIEKSIVQRYYKKGVRIIDTTHLTLKNHKQKIDKILKEDKKENLSLSILSFGYKNGIPEDADNVFDVRFLDNPFYDPKLKNKTGKDKAVKEFVLGYKRTQMYLKKITSYLDFMLKSYSKEEKRHLTIAIGCTGGQHRSVVIANYLYNLYKDKYVCLIKHREIEK
ncbi:MAG: RNase adapter RapZ [Erysipelotrichaceae bacterium]|nr:RNase adapter RapZ [Erysipelotrichaceae bacterium]